MSQNTLLFLLLASSAFLAFSQNRIDCDPDNRPSPQDCFSPDSVITQTCAYYSENCPFEVCGRHAFSGCNACSNPDVLYYKLQLCEPELIVSECYDGYCDPESQSTNVFEPVCGVRSGCSDASDSDCSMTFDNACEACSNSKYPWYYSGVCKEDRRSCNSSKNLDSSSTKEVCAYFPAEFGNIRYTTVKNAYTACSDDAVNYYTKGECAGPYYNNVTYCLPNVRPEVCTEEYNPVCGFFMTSDQLFDHRIMGNACAACGDPSIIYYQPGPCEFSCNREPNTFVECDGSAVNPICGKYQDTNGQTQQISLKNACTGCFDISTLIDTYTDGLCPDDIGIRCANDAEGAVMGTITPVCGHFEEDCDDDSCRQTFSEPATACRNEDVVLYVPGLCPGDEGIPCIDYRVRPEADAPVFIDGLAYNNVCGFREKGCDDSSCRDDFRDVFDACADESVQFFTQGPCA